MPSERLSNLIVQRDAIEEALGTGRDYVELEIRGRRVRKQASTEVLAYLNQQITRLESEEARRVHGPARNVARVRR